MFRWVLFAALTGLLTATTTNASPPPAPSPTTVLKLSGPYHHANLTLFLIRGPDTAPSKKVITLKEAMERKLVEVHETSTVNVLSIENKSTEFEIFIMSGDVVKGGKQDRVIAFDVVVPPKSGAVPLPSFCVEAGRWKKRGAEDVSKFGCSDNQVVSRGLKIAVNEARQQGEVWKEVEVAQKKLSDNIGKNVQSAASPTSLQLCLEDKDLQAKIDAYEKALNTCCEQKSDVIGVVVSVNGAVSSADIFSSADLFTKLWPKLLRSAATEALSEMKADLKFKACDAERVQAFLAEAGKGDVKEVVMVQARNPAAQQSARGDGGRVQAPIRDSSGGAPTAATSYRVKIKQVATAKCVLIEAHDNDKPGIVWHRSYIAK